MQYRENYINIFHVSIKLKQAIQQIGVVQHRLIMSSVKIINICTLNPLYNDNFIVSVKVKFIYFKYTGQQN